MRNKFCLFAITLFAAPLLARAETPAGGESNSLFVNLLYSLLPFLLLGIVFYFLFGKYLSRSRGIQEKYKVHMDRQEAHMQRIEQCLERIASALEKKE